MNNFQKKLPKDKKTISYQSEVQAMVLQINRLVQQKNYAKAYTLAEKYQARLNSKGFFTDEERDLVRKALMNAIEKDLSKEIRREYFETLKFYSSNYSALEQKNSPYADSPKLYVRAKAKEEVMEKFKNRRFGAYMHVVINDVVDKCNTELDLKNKKKGNDQVKNKLKLIRLDKKDDDKDDDFDR